MKKKHRNSQKRIYFEDVVYFVTCKTEGGHPFFKKKVFCDLFVENLRICKKLKGFYLYGWVLLYNHFHLLIRPSDKFNISKIMHFLKRHVSRNINIVMGNTTIKSNTTHEGEVGQPRLRGNGDSDVVKTIEHFDQYISELKTQYAKKHTNKNPHPRFQWQKSYHDHYIRNKSDFNYHMEYIIWNPQKHKMPDNWSYIFTNPDYEDLIDNPL